MALIDQDKFYWSCPSFSCNTLNQAIISEAQISSQTCEACEVEYCIDFKVRVDVKSIITIEESDKLWRAEKAERDAHAAKPTIP